MWIFSREQTDLSTGGAGEGGRGSNGSLNPSRLVRFCLHFSLRFPLASLSLSIFFLHSSLLLFWAFSPTPTYLPMSIPMLAYALPAGWWFGTGRYDGERKVASSETENLRTRISFERREIGRWYCRRRRKPRKRCEYLGPREGRRSEVESELAQFRQLHLSLPLPFSSFSDR